MNLIRPLPDILAPLKDAATFDQLLAVMQEFVGYIEKVEGVKAVAIHPSEDLLLRERFSRFPAEMQQKKFQRFSAYYTHCQELAAEGISLKDKATSLKSFMRKFGLIFPNEDSIFEVLDQQTFVEIYDLDFIQCYRSIDFLNATTHSMMALETCEWWDLFERSAHINEGIMRVVQSLYNGSVSEPVYLPVESHTVKELGSQTPLSSQTDIILYSPVYDEQGLFQGGLHFFKVKSVYSLDFKVWN